MKATIPTEVDLWNRCEESLDALSVIIASRHMGIKNPNLEAAELECRKLTSAMIELHARFRGEQPNKISP